MPNIQMMDGRADERAEIPPVFFGAAAFGQPVSSLLLNKIQQAKVEKGQFGCKSESSVWIGFWLFQLKPGGQD